MKDGPTAVTKNGVYRRAGTGSVELLPFRTLPTYFRWTGEVRPPKSGEWFLSGAIVEAYEATSNMKDTRHIANPIADPPQIIEKDGFKYRLEG
jgi:hypothetical protein